MGERFWVRFHVGGECYEVDRDRLVSEMMDQGPEDTPEWGEHLSAEFPEVNWGDLEDIETLCKECGLSWDKVVDAKSGYDAAIWWWRPGMEEARHCPAHESEPAVYASALQELLDSGASAEDIQTWLATRVPPELPPFTIITGDPSNDPETNPAA